MKRIARHVRGHCIAYLALFLVLGGTSVAAVQALPKNSITSKQIKNGTILKADLAKSTIAALHGARGLRGPLTDGRHGCDRRHRGGGRDGATGPAGPFPGNLPSGKTDRGACGVLAADWNNAYARPHFVLGFTSFPPDPSIDYIPSGTAVPAACAGGIRSQCRRRHPRDISASSEAFHSGLHASGACDPATNSTTTAGRTGAVVLQRVERRGGRPTPRRHLRGDGAVAAVR